MFNKSGYKVVKNHIHKDVLDLMYEYYTLKSENNELLFDDNQVQGTLVLYGDTLNDTLMKTLTPLAEKVVGEKLFPCYSFLRIYNNLDFLKPHTDRPSCEFSATIPIRYDEKWPILMCKYDFDKYGEEGHAQQVVDSKPKPKSISLSYGDVCFYEGTQMNHWRLPYKGTECVQLFIHYVRQDGKYKEYKYDKRPNLGMKRKDFEKTEQELKQEQLESYFK